MDLRKIKKLIELVEESGIAELEVSSGDESVRIAMSSGGVVTPLISTPARAAVPVSGSATSANSITAPMAGTFYAAPHPDAAPYVVSGSRVEVGQVICIIESMKMMHEIKAASAGTVEQVCVENGSPVGTGDTLFRLG